MKFNPIKVIIEVYKNIKTALTDPDSALNMIGLEPLLREEEQRMAATKPQSHKKTSAEASTEKVSHYKQSEG